MSEKSPQSPIEQSNEPEETIFHEGLPPRDEAIDAVRSKMSELQTEIDDAKEKAGTPGFRASANDLIEAKTGLRDLRAKNGPKIAALQEMWRKNGGEEIEAAEADAEALNFKSDANDHVAAKTRLRDAKNTFYANLEADISPAPGESMAPFGNNDVVAFDPAAKKAERDAAEIEAYKIKAVEDEKAAVTPEERERAHEDALAEYQTREGRSYEDASAEKEAAKRDADFDKWDAERGRFSKLMDRPFGTLMRFSDKLHSLGRDREKGRDGKRSKRRLALGIGIAAGGAIAMSYLLYKSGQHPHSRGVVTPITDSGNGSDPNAAIRGDYAPKLADSKVHGGLDQLPFSPDARKVSPGEGWYETMTQAGIAPEKQASILHNDEVMEQLRKMGLAYKAPELGGWGISMPEDGKMPAEALEILTNAAS